MVLVGFWTPMQLYMYFLSTTCLNLYTNTPHPPYSYLHAKSIIHRDLKSNSILTIMDKWNRMDWRVQKGSGE